MIIKEPILEIWAPLRSFKPKALAQPKFQFLKWDGYKSLILLTGNRPLSPEIESVLVNPFASLYSFRPDWTWDEVFPSNESEMAALLLKQLDLPKE